MAGQDIEMNAFKLLADAAYIYGEAADGSQVKMKKSDILSTIDITAIADLNEAYKTFQAGLSIVYVGNTMNSPISYGLCIHAQRSSSGDKSGSQFIFQAVSGGGHTFIREGSGNGSIVNYSSWRKI